MRTRGRRDGLRQAARCRRSKFLVGWRAGQQPAKNPARQAVHDDQPIAGRPAIGDPAAQARRHGGIGLSIGRGPDQPVGADDRPRLGDDVGVPPPAPAREAEFGEARIGARGVPVEFEMLRDDRQRLQGAARGRRP
jgi:hypothetical protein